MCLITLWYFFSASTPFISLLFYFSPIVFFFLLQKKEKKTVQGCSKPIFLFYFLISNSESGIHFSLSFILNECGILIFNTSYFIRHPPPHLKYSLLRKCTHRFPRFVDWILRRYLRSRFHVTSNLGDNGICDVRYTTRIKSLFHLIHFL